MALKFTDEQRKAMQEERLAYIATAPKVVSVGGVKVTDMTESRLISRQMRRHIV